MLPEIVGPEDPARLARTNQGVEEQGNEEAEACSQRSNASASTLLDACRALNVGCHGGAAHERPHHNAAAVGREGPCGLWKLLLAVDKT